MERSAHLLVSIELIQIDSFTERIIHLVKENCEIEKYGGGECSKTKDRLTVKPYANPFTGLCCCGRHREECLNFRRICFAVLTVSFKE